MKKIVSIAIIGAAVLLTGCATDVPLSVSDKADIKSGKLVKFTKYFNDTSEKMKNGGAVYVCAVSTNRPTPATPCYPQLSAYISKYFADEGIKIVKSREHASEVVYATLQYTYMNADLSYFSGGDSYRAMFDSTIEDSLEKNGKPELSKATMETIYNKDKSMQKSVAQQSNLETAGKVLVGLAAMAIGGVNGGLQANQALNSMANPSSIEAPYGTIGPKQMMIFLHEEGQGGDVSKGPRLVFGAAYYGPRDIFDAFGNLFPSAVKSTAELFAKNTSTSTVGAK